MSNESGPWARRAPPSPPPPARGRPLLWVALIAGVLAIVAALAKAFPGAVQGDDWGFIGYKVGFVALVAAGLFRVGRGSLGEHLRNAAIWAVIIGVLALGASYADEFAGAG